MRTPEEVDLDVFTAHIRFIIWSNAREVEYTLEELNAAIMKAFGADPWKDELSNGRLPRIIPVECFEPTRSEPGGNQYVVAAELRVKAGQIRAFSRNVLAADKFLREHPPRECRDLFTHLSFYVVIG